MNDTDRAARLLAHLDHVRSWLRDHPAVAATASWVDITVYTGAMRVWVDVPTLLEIGAPTRTSAWSPSSLGGRQRSLELHLDGIDLVAVQRATDADIAAAERA